MVILISMVVQVSLHPRQISRRGRPKDSLPASAFLKHPYASWEHERAEYVPIGLPY